MDAEKGLHDIQQAHYTPLPECPTAAGPPTTLRRPFKDCALVIASIVFLMSLVALILNQSQELSEKPAGKDGSVPLVAETASFSQLRGVAEGVSAKSNPSLSDELSYNWTNAMFSWQRTSFHFQPEKNWMNGSSKNTVFLMFLFSASLLMIDFLYSLFLFKKLFVFIFVIIINVIFVLMGA